MSSLTTAFDPPQTSSLLSRTVQPLKTWRRCSHFWDLWTSIDDLPPVFLELLYLWQSHWQQTLFLTGNLTVEMLLIKWETACSVSLLWSIMIHPGQHESRLTLLENQEHPDGWHLVAYLSRTMTSAERNYPILLLLLGKPIRTSLEGKLVGLISSVSFLSRFSTARSAQHCGRRLIQTRRLQTNQLSFYSGE